MTVENAKHSAKNGVHLDASQLVKPLLLNQGIRGGLLSEPETEDIGNKWHIPNSLELDETHFIDELLCCTLMLQADDRISISLGTHPRHQINTTLAQIADAHEPVRRCTHFARPKQYHRSFWASLARRALAEAKAVNCPGFRK